MIAKDVSICQYHDGSMSNCVETSTGWYKPQEHLSPVDFGISETVGDAF